MSLGLYEIIQNINKQIKNLCCQVKDLIENGGIPGPPGPQGEQGIQGEKGDKGDTGGFGAYGSWYSTVDQINTVGGTLAMTVNNTDFQSGVSIVGGSQITFAAAGKYNIQFSAQLNHRSGGGPGKHVDIWFAKNGNAIPFSNTRVDVDTNTPYQVAAWNFFVDAAAGDYYQIMWTTANDVIVLEQEAVGSPHPATPSVIITVNQVGA